MFSVHCPEAGAEILLGPRSILSMHNTQRGVVSYFRCRCGATGVLVSGRASLEEVVHHPARRSELEPTREPVPAAVGTSPVGTSAVGADAMADCA